MLVLAPHPDDEVFGCGGAIVRQIQSGGAVRVVIFTDGGFGALPEMHERYVSQRRLESLAAAKVLGYGEPAFKDYKDRSLRYCETLIDDIIDTVRESAADLICAPSVMEMHPDHRALGMATVEALRRIDEPLQLAFYEVGVPLHPNLLLDITAAEEKKRQAMRCFSSQLENQQYDLQMAGLNRFRSYTLPSEVTAAEAFIIVSAEKLNTNFLDVYRPWYSIQQSLGLPTEAADIPLCSVLIRSTNRKTLREALDSVAVQTWPNVEVVVVNATGARHDVLGQYCGRFPLRLIEPGKPLDRAHAANHAIDAARGALLLFLDDDDFILPQHLTRLVQAFEGNNQVMASYAGVVCTDEDGQEVRRFSQPFDPVMLRLENYLPIHAVLFRRDVLTRGVRFDESLPLCEDWDFWLQILEHWGEKAFRSVAETGAVYRVLSDGGSGVWREPERTRGIMLRIYRKWLAIWSDDTLWSLLELGRYKKLYHERDKKLGELAARVQQQNDELLLLRQALSEQERRGTSLSRELASHAARASQAEAELQGLRNHHAGSLAAIASLREAILERDHRIESLYNSRSWQITRPLRAVTGFLGKHSSPRSDPLVAQQQMANGESQGFQTEPVQSLATASPAQAALHIQNTHPEQTPGFAHQTYDYAVDLDSESAGAFVFRLVGKHRRVLELGCGPGSVTRILAGLGGCRVTGIEFDAASVEKARPFCEQIFQADLNDAAWPEVLGNPAPFEVVVAADVLEHLYDPWRTLRLLRPLLDNRGALVLSLPHAGHAALAASFLSGNVAYRDWGLLDRTHIRFFGLRDIERLVRQAGFKIVEAHYVCRSPEASELAENWIALPESVRQALRNMPDADIYQVVVRAVPDDAPERAIKLGRFAEGREAQAA